MSRECIGVVGLGLLGRGIAACFLGHGHRVIGYARDAGEHAAALGPITTMADDAEDAAAWKDLHERHASRASQTIDEYFPLEAPAPITPLARERS